MTDALSPKCPRCGTALAASAPEGLCPRCLLEMNLSAATILTDDEKPEEHAEPPSLEKIAPLFPQLEILEYLGRGGMGVVYKARQRSLDRFVALKILAPERETEPEFAMRFTREALALARLNHPHIVTVHDFGEAKGEGGGAFFYLLMEFVDGVNLRHLLRARRLRPEEALAIVPPICEALQYAHERGIVHRDIKPENLLLDKDGRVKIADFGVAKMLGVDANIEKKSAGTPAYMAPEQQSASATSDHRADIYSLGVVLYEMLTGELPSSSFEPRSARLRGMHLDVRLDEIVLRALQAQPELRYRTALDLKTQLELVTAGASLAHGRANPAPNPSFLPESSKKPEKASVVLRETQTCSVASRPRRRRIVRLGLLSLLVLGSVIATILVLRREYFAKVIMELPPNKVSSSRPWLAHPFYTQFLNAQFQILRSPEILNQVIERLDLAKILSDGRQLSIPKLSARLANSLELREIPNTGLMELGVYNRDPSLAANIANTIAITYTNKRFTELQSSVDRALQLLTDQVETQRKRVKKARSEMEEIRDEEQIIDPDPESFNSASMIADDRYREAKRSYLQAKKVFEVAEIKYSLESFDGTDFEPVRIWEQAKAPPYPRWPSFHQLWQAILP